MKKIINAILIGLFVLCGCSDENKEGKVAPAELIKSVDVRASDTNALRMNVTLEFKKDVRYQIEYWKAEDLKTVHKTELSAKLKSDNKTLIFLEASSEYNFRVLVTTETEHAESKTYTFRTGNLPGNIHTYNVVLDEMTTELNGYVLVSKRDAPGFMTLIDTKGNIVWYESIPAGVRVVNFDSRNNTFTAITGTSKTKGFAGNGILVIDLYGNRILDKDISEIYPHHDSRLLPNGDIILVNYVPETYDLSRYGGSTEETVWGDGYTVMDIKGNIKYQWSVFDEISPLDDPNVMTTKEDWVHANAVNYDEAGNYYMTFNHLSQLWKIDPNTGKVLYRLGPGGNVDMPEIDYANGIHTPYLLAEDKIELFDNGKSRGYSRMLVYDVNESVKKATATLKVNFPNEYSSQFRSNAKRIKDDLIIFGSSGASAIIFTNLEGKPLRIISTTYSPYRAEYIEEIKY